MTVTGAPRKASIRFIVTYVIDEAIESRLQITQNILSQIALEFNLTQEIIVISHASKDTREFHRSMEDLEAKGILPTSHVDLLIQLKGDIVGNHGNYIRVKDPCVIILEHVPSPVSAAHELFHLYFDTREPGIQSSVEFFCEYLALVRSRPKEMPEFDRERFLAGNQLTPQQFLLEADEIIETIHSNHGSFLQTEVSMNNAYFQRYFAAWRYFGEGGQDTFSKPWQDFIKKLSSVDPGKAAILADLRSILIDAQDVDDRSSVEAKVTEALTRIRSLPEKNDCSIYHIDYDS